MTPRDTFDLRFPDPPGPGAPGPRPSRRPPSAHPALRASSPRPLSRRALLGGAGALALTSAPAARSTPAAPPVPALPGARRPRTPCPGVPSWAGRGP